MPLQSEFLPLELPPPPQDNLVDSRYNLPPQHRHLQYERDKRTSQSSYPYAASGKTVLDELLPEQATNAARFSRETSRTVDACIRRLHLLLTLEAHTPFLSRSKSSDDTGFEAILVHGSLAKSAARLIVLASGSSFSYTQGGGISITSPRSILAHPSYVALSLHSRTLHHIDTRMNTAVLALELA